MRVVVAGFLVMLAVLAVRADDEPDKKPPGPRAELDALRKEHSAAQQAFAKAVNGVEDDKERDKVMKEEAPKIDKVLAKFIALAEKHPKDDVAVEALLVAASDTFAARAGGTAKKKALEMLAKDYLTSEKIGPLCSRLSREFDSTSDKMLRTILEKNPSKAVQAEACLGLMQSLNGRASIGKRLGSDKDLMKRAIEFLGKETADQLAKLDIAKLDEEGAALAKQFADKYAADMSPQRLAGLCQQLAFSPNKGSEILLRKFAEHDKTDVKAMAVLGLAQLLKQQAEDKSEKDAKAADAIRKESEKLYEEAAEKYGDVKAGFRGTIGEMAKRELYELRHLAVGKPAPEVSGEDQDGKKFALADYKGKVVLLDFWSQF